MCKKGREAFKEMANHAEYNKFSFFSILRTVVSSQLAFLFFFFFSGLLLPRCQAFRQENSRTLDWLKRDPVIVSNILVRKTLLLATDGPGCKLSFPGWPRTYFEVQGNVGVRQKVGVHTSVSNIHHHRHPYFSMSSFTSTKLGSAISNLSIHHRHKFQTFLSKR